MDPTLRSIGAEFSGTREVVTRSRSDNRALLVGMSYYVDTSLRDLTGVERDVEELTRVLEENADGTPNFEVTPLVSTYERPLTADLLLRELDLLIDEVEDNHLLFYFSGHGIVGPYGFQLATAEKSGAFDSGIHFDVLLHRFNQMRGAVTVILDCCYSGAAGDRNVVFDGRSLVMTYIREDVTILASSTRNQRALLEDGELSDYTAAVVEALQGGGAAGQGVEVDALQVHSHARAKLVGQTPVVRLFGSAQHCLRRS